VAELSYSKHKDTLDLDEESSGSEFEALAPGGGASSGSFDDDCLSSNPHDAATTPPPCSFNRLRCGSHEFYLDGKPRPLLRGAIHGAVAWISLFLVIAAAVSSIERG
jgi:hypothetical protein